jgi:hypothetical protein
MALFRKPRWGVRVMYNTGKSRIIWLDNEKAQLEVCARENKNRGDHPGGVRYAKCVRR